MTFIKKFKQYFEDNNPNTPQGYLNSLSKQPKTKPNKLTEEKKPTDEVDSVLRDTEKQKEKILKQKDTIEKGLLNNIKNMEDDNQKEVKQQVDDYQKQVKEFDKTVSQIDKLKKELDKSNKPDSFKSNMSKARQKNI